MGNKHVKCAVNGILFIYYIFCLFTIWVFSVPDKMFMINEVGEIKNICDLRRAIVMDDDGETMVRIGIILLLPLLSLAIRKRFKSFWLNSAVLSLLAMLFWFSYLRYQLC